MGYGFLLPDLAICPVCAGRQPGRDLGLTSGPGLRHAESSFDAGDTRVRTQISAFGFHMGIGTSAMVPQTRAPGVNPTR